MKEMNKQKIHNKNSLGPKMLALAVLPVLALGIVLLGVGMHAFSKSMENHVQKEKTEETKLILKILDQNYPGESSLNKDEKGNYHIYKGGKDITKDTEFIDNMKDIMGVDVTLFCQDVRLQTTLRDAKGRLFINTAVSSVITKDVLKKKKPHFYQSTTTVSNERNFAYYDPIFLQDGTWVGMVGVCRRAADVEENIRTAILPILFVCLAAMFVIGAISIWYAHTLAARIRALQIFMKKLPQEEFDTELPSHLLKSGDELGDLARSGKKMQESGIEYCVAIGDIDFFKKVNDRYGHEAGDVVLTKVARILREKIMSKGYVCRWGGEEFLIVLEDCEQKQAKQILQDVLDVLRGQSIECQGQNICVTMSVGVVQVASDEKIDDILRRADKKLYDAKAGGRDRICD